MPAFGNLPKQLPKELLKFGSTLLNPIGRFCIFFQSRKMTEAWINLEWALARSKFVYIETHLQKVILLQRNEIAQERWEMHFLTKETAWTQECANRKCTQKERKSCRVWLLRLSDTEVPSSQHSNLWHTHGSYKDSCKLNRTWAQTGLSYKNQTSVTALTAALWFASQAFSTSKLI